MPDSCKELLSVSKKTHKWISTQSNVGEESLTDWILYEISQRISKTGYIKFNRHQEARKTGADWEWWFIGNKKSLRLRVQAKKIEGTKDVYPSLAYTNKYGLQIEKLIDDSKSAKVNAIPIYALYTAPSGIPEVKCTGKPDSGKGEGVFISDANYLFNKYIKPGRSKITPESIIEDSNPLSCLLCCPISNGGDPVFRLKEFISYYFTEEEGARGSNDNVGLHDNYPNYVHHIVENMDGEIPEWWEQEFSRELDEFDAVMVFDYREKNSA